MPPNQLLKELMLLVENGSYEEVKVKSLEAIKLYTQHGSPEGSQTNPFYWSPFILFGNWK